MLATAPKSNSVMGFFDALAAVEREREGEVPNHLKDSNRDKHSFGHGANYLYPHSYREHWVAQQYLPGSLQGQVFYQPSNQGYEDQIQQSVARQREAQLAALVEVLPEVLTFSPADSTTDRWLQRTQSPSRSAVRSGARSPLHPDSAAAASGDFGSECGQRLIDLGGSAAAYPKAAWLPVCDRLTTRRLCRNRRQLCLR